MRLMRVQLGRGVPVGAVKVDHARHRLLARGPHQGPGLVRNLGAVLGMLPSDFAL